MARCYYLDYESNGNLKLLPHYEREDSEQIHSDSSKSIRTISKIIIERRLHEVFPAHCNYSMDCSGWCDYDWDSNCWSDMD